MASDENPQKHLGLKETRRSENDGSKAYFNANHYQSSSAGPSSFAASEGIYDVFNHILVPLGVTTTHKFAYYIRSTKQVRFLTASEHTEMNLLSMATEDTWVTAIARQPMHFQSAIMREVRGTPKRTKSAIYWPSLAAELMQMCRDTGRFDPVKIRGRGIWFRNDGTSIVNTGNDLWTLQNGTSLRQGLAEQPPKADDPQFYVSTAEPFDPPAERMLTDDEAVDLHIFLGRFTYANCDPTSGLVLGFVACTPLLSSLPFRPQIAITAEKGAGKTQLIRALKRIIGTNNVLYFEGAMSTEPGIRQTLANNALPMLIDEFETTNPTAKAILDLLRLASNAEGTIAKGTPHGQPMHFAPITAAVIAGISMRMPDAATASRFAIIELTKQRHTEKEATDLHAAIESIPSDLGARIARTMLERRSLFNENMRLAKAALIAKDADNRQADLYGTLYAGKWTLLSGHPMSLEDAERELSWYSADSGDDMDHRACLDHLLAHHLRLAVGHTHSVGELLHTIRNDSAQQLRLDDERRALADLGLRYDQKSEEIIVANTAPSLLRLYAGTPWANGQHAKVLGRMGGHNNDNKTIRFGASHAGKATAISWHRAFPEADDANDG